MTTWPVSSRYKLPLNTTINVDNVNGSDSATWDDIYSGAPLATLTEAVINRVHNLTDLSGASSYGVRIKLADSAISYPGVHLPDPFMGAGGRRSVLIEGNATIPSNTIISDCVDNGSPISAFNKVVIAVRCVKLISAHGACLSATDGAEIRLLDGIEFGSAVAAHMFAANRGVIYMEPNNYTISGGAQFHSQTIGSPGSCTNLSGCTANFIADCSFTDFMYSQQYGHIAAGGWSCNINGHTVNGSKFYVDSLGYIQIDGANPNSVFPGSSNGTIGTNGYCY